MTNFEELMKIQEHKLERQEFCSSLRESVLKTDDINTLKVMYLSLLESYTDVLDDIDDAKFKAKVENNED